MYKIIYQNNTDYPKPIELTLAEAKAIIEAQSQEWGDQYWESWEVEGDYPNEVYDILEPKELEGWRRK